MKTAVYTNVIGDRVSYHIIYSKKT